MDPLEINIKGHFANERTFLHWLSLCIILGALSISILNFSGNWVAASVFAVVSLVFMFYALYQFLDRNSRLDKAKKSLDARGLAFEDMNGAIAMVAVVVLAMLLNYISVVNK